MRNSDRSGARKRVIAEGGKFDDIAAVIECRCLLRRAAAALERKEEP